jgi:hypothetical protein
MATTSTNNFLNYTGMTHEEIETQVTNKLNADPKFETFLESSIAQTIIEIFSGATDLTNYYLERRAEESYLDTAKLKSSVILLAKQLGYVVTRPIPATTALNMRIFGNLSDSGITVGTTIPLTKFNTTFTHNGLNYIMTDSLEYTVTQEDIDAGKDLDKDISYAYTTSGVLVPDTVATSAVDDIALLQGDIERITIEASSNSQLSQVFQNYKINDSKFSNLYGTEDITYDAEDATFDLVNNLTKVGIANDSNLIYATSAEDNNLFEIDRRSLINQESLSSYGDAKKLCYIRTHMDGTVEILFGDGNFASTGPKTINDNIYIQYFSTEGKNANKIGVIDDIINVNQDIKTDGTSPGISVNSHLEFTLRKNITGGANLEDIDSIRYNAPGIYAALDRVVTAGDYGYFLKTITSPINVKNAIAWGEQEEVRANNVKAIFKMFNVVFYSVLGEIYNIYSPSTSEVKPLSGTDSLQDGIVLEGTNYNPIDVTSSNSYFNLFIKQSLPSEVGRIDFLSETDPVRQMYDKVNAKSQVTVANVYTTPIIQDFEVRGTVYVNKLADKLSVRTRANNNVYNQLNELADFHIPIYKSNISELIEEIPEVKYLDIEFVPTDLELESLGALDEEPAITAYSTSATIISIINDGIGNYMEDAGIATSNYANISIDYSETETLSVDPWHYFSQDWILEDRQHQRVDNINERTFLLELVKPIYDEMASSSVQEIINYKDSTDFQEIVKKMHNSLWNIIKSSMMDKNGNIINYSMRNEIARLDLSNLSYVFAT